MIRVRDPYNSTEQADVCEVCADMESVTGLEYVRFFLFQLLH